MSYLFTSESVSEGHPDKVCDQISDAVLDLFLSRDKTARAAVETLATTNRIILAGETACHEYITPEEIADTVRQTVRKIGYDQKNFSWQTVKIENLLHHQSPDIAAGVDRNGAGDQGLMFGYAEQNEEPDTEYMPLAIHYAHRLLQNLAAARHNGTISGIEPDAKSQVTIRYNDNGKPLYADSIVLSTQHAEHLSQDEVHAIAKEIIKETLPEKFLTPQTNILINPTGRFVIGGPDGDTGLTGRKIIVDTYGGYAPHGGGAFSGKDATKVDRSAAYMLRYLAKNIVAAGLAGKCLLQISYAIGYARPLSLYINCFGSEKTDTGKILKFLQDNLDLSPTGIIKHLKLDRPVYSPTAAYGHFGRPAVEPYFSWEKLDLQKELISCF